MPFFRSFAAWLCLAVSPLFAPGAEIVGLDPDGDGIHTYGDGPAHVQFEENSTLPAQVNSVLWQIWDSDQEVVVAAGVSTDADEGFALSPDAFATLGNRPNALLQALLRDETHNVVARLHATSGVVSLLLPPDPAPNPTPDPAPDPDPPPATQPTTVIDLSPSDGRAVIELRVSPATQPDLDVELGGVYVDPQTGEEKAVLFVLNRLMVEPNDVETDQRLQQLHDQVLAVQATLAVLEQKIDAMGGVAPSDPPVSDTVNINTAGVEALSSLPGIGVVKAGAIVADREANGPFLSVDDLDRVTGIGPATIEALRHRVTVDAAD